MLDDTEPIVSKTALAHGIILPDGKQPIPLGSGSIAGLLGVGGMSNVYKIWNPQLEQYRAVKLMKPDLSPESRQRFQTEIKITAALSHPNIIEIHSVGEWHSLSFIEMEFIDGATLAETIANKGALPMKVCVALGIVMARALTYAHGREYTLYGKTYRGLIHRDLKTSNIMIGIDGRVKLMDFGIARPVETSLMTMDGAVMGTMQYLAPEQIDGKNVGVAADLYALGAIMYESITGRKAFPQKNLSQLMSAKTANIFVPLRFFNLRIPARLKRLVTRCMQLDPAKRPASAGELLSDLEAIHRNLTDESPEQVLQRFAQDRAAVRVIHTFRRRLPVMAIAAALAISLCVGIGVGFYITAGRRSAPPEPVTSAPGIAPSIPSPVEEHRSDPVAREKETGTPGSAGQTARATRRSTRGAGVSDPVPASGTSRSDAAKKNTAPSPAVSLFDSLRESTGITDPIEQLAYESRANRHLNVLRLYDGLPPAIAERKEARLMRLRALMTLGKTEEVRRLFAGQPINDGEYYLLKARYLIERGEPDSALASLESSVSVGSTLLDASQVRRDYLFYRAVSLGKRFERSPTEVLRRSALDGWFEVKNALRQNPDHAYFRKAVAEMQKIGQMQPAAKG